MFPLYGEVPASPGWVIQPLPRCLDLRADLIWFALRRSPHSVNPGPAAPPVTSAADARGPAASTEVSLTRLLSHC